MIDLIERLKAHGHTYEADGSVYFRIASFPEYGRLSGLDVSGIRDGARVDTDKYDKENARDFVLWKFKSDEPEWAQWDAPFGRGRPGWHVECSAMSMKYLGETFDLHVGGEDLIFPHHENEIAQSTGATGHPFVRHWLHVKHLLIDDETMSKSKGNFFTIPDIVARGHRPEAIRYLLAGAHYRKPLNFGFEGLQQAAAAIDRIHSLVERLAEVDGKGDESPAAEASEAALKTFEEALADDLNTPEALAAVHGLVGRANALMAEAEGRLPRAGAAIGPSHPGDDGLGLRRFLPLVDCRQLVGGGASAFRRATGGPQAARVCPGRRRSRSPRGDGCRSRGHAPRDSLAAEALIPTSP